MTENSLDKWPGRGSNDKMIVHEMLNDPFSYHWTECIRFFEQLVKLNRDLPVDIHGDIVQNAILSVIKNLPIFRFDCKFSTWLVYIVRSRVSDARREMALAKSRAFPVQNGPTENEEGEEDDREAIFGEQQTSEDICIAREELSEMWAAIADFINSHGKSERNRQIVLKVLFEQRSIGEAAEESGVSPAVAGHVIRSVRRHLLEKFRNEPLVNLASENKIHFRPVSPWR